MKLSSEVVREIRHHIDTKLPSTKVEVPVEMLAALLTKATADIRDDFAKAALTGLLANSEGVHAGETTLLDCLQGSSGLFYATLAKHAYGLANAAMRAREL